MQATMKLRVVEHLLEIAYFFCILCLFHMKTIKIYHKMKFESKKQFCLEGDLSLIHIISNVLIPIFYTQIHKCLT